MLDGPLEPRESENPRPHVSMVIILGFHPRDSGSSPDSGIFFCLLRPRACVRAPARVWGPWGLCARAARVWGFGGVFCLWGFGAGKTRRGACGGLLTRVEGGGFDFFLPKKGPTGPVSAGPAGPRRGHAGAKGPALGGARGAPPAPRRRVPRRHLAFTPRARRRS